jgi:hypothetical protein
LRLLAISDLNVHDNPHEGHTSQGDLERRVSAGDIKDGDLGRHSTTITRHALLATPAYPQWVALREPRMSHKRVSTGAQPQQGNLGRTSVAYACELGHALTEPKQFGYTPGRGVAATIDGESVLVGNSALLTDRSLAVPDDLRAQLSEHPNGSEVHVARAGQVLGALVVANTRHQDACKTAALTRGVGAIGR